MRTRAVIQSIGHALPSKTLTNSDLMEIVETSDEWITQRTGIKQRQICETDEQGTGWLSLRAAGEALKNSGLSAEEIDLIVVGTVTGDYLWPATACMIQNELGARNAGAYDVSAACAGFIYSLHSAACMIEAEHINTAIVVGADALSKQVDWTDRSTCVLFGDAAGAVVIKGERDTDRGLIDTVLMSDGSGGKHISLEVGGTKYPFGSPQAEGRRDKIFMAGAEVYRFAVQAMGDACCKVLDKSGMQPEDVDLFVPHQANLRIIESAAKRLNLPDEKVYVNVDRYGNTSGGSIPLALYEAVRDGKLKKDMVVMTVGFGAGLVWGANLIRW